MGLLDGLLGQVLGGMTQGGGMPGGMGRTGGSQGGLDDLLNQLGGAGMPRGGGMGMPAGGGGTGGGLVGAALPALLMLGLQMLQRNGGIEGVLGRMRATGHAREADSWVSTGQNAPIDPSVLSDLFGRDQIESMAKQTGLSPQQAQGGLAALFPEIVNQMTPQGRVETGSDDVVQQALEMLRQKQGMR
jgi:uncharacterized protein YidB (DUF937 family)